MSINDYEFSKDLEDLLGSYLFENKSQMRRLLNYLIENIDSPSEAAFDQRAIAIECLGRSEDFDPAENPAVRIEISRLRKLLEHYYTEEISQSYKITIPLGQYRPQILPVSINKKLLHLPELQPSPASPERLSVLLQFTTEGVDNSELYLLRHQVRIGITIALSRQDTVRLLVAIPGEDGKVADSVDFIMRVSLASVGTEFLLTSQVCTADSEDLIYSNKESLASHYQSDQIDELLGFMVSKLFDPEVGVLWHNWVNKRESYQEVGALKVMALVQYQRYLFDESKANISQAFFDLLHAHSAHPGDKIINAALADIYYRMVIHDYNVVNDAIDEGLRHIREALRFSPASEKLHILHGIMSALQEGCELSNGAIVAADLIAKPKYFSSSFHYLILRCLVTEFNTAFNELKVLCDHFDCYPKLYAAIVYLHHLMLAEKKQAAHWRGVIKKQDLSGTVCQFIRHIKLPCEWSKGRDQLLVLASEDLKEAD